VIIYRVVDGRALTFERLVQACGELEKSLVL
jgi:hypothetical protein